MRLASMLVATALLLAPVAACRPDEPVSAPATAAAPASAGPLTGPPMGGDSQPQLRDVVRVGLTKKQRDRIVKACADAQEITKDNECRESIPQDAPTFTSPSPDDETCGPYDYCMILDKPDDEVVVVDDSRSEGNARLRLPVTDSVIDDIIDVAPAETSEATTSPETTNSAETTETTEPTQETLPPETPAPDAS
jgi:hypothetical protein